MGNWFAENVVALVAVAIAVVSLLTTLTVTARYADTHFSVKVAPVTKMSADGRPGVELALTNEGTSPARRVRIALISDPLGAHAPLRPKEWLTLSAGETVVFAVEGYRYDDSLHGNSQYNLFFHAGRESRASLIEVRWTNPIFFKRRLEYELPRLPLEPEFKSEAARQAWESRARQ